MTAIRFSYQEGIEPRHVEPVEPPSGAAAAWREAATFLAGSLEIQVGDLVVGAGASAFLFHELVPLLESLEGHVAGAALEWRACMSEVGQESELLLYEHESAVVVILRQLTPDRSATQIEMSLSEALSCLRKLARDSCLVLAPALREIYGAAGEGYAETLLLRTEAVRGTDVSD